MVAAMVDSIPTRAHGRSPDIAPEHRRAICNEIGEQLRGSVTDDLTPLPSRLEGLVERLTELDGDVPPIALDRQDDASPWPLWNFVSALWRLLRSGP